MMKGKKERMRDSTLTLQTSDMLRVKSWIFLPLASVFIFLPGCHFITFCQNQLPLHYSVCNHTPDCGDIMSTVTFSILWNLSVCHPEMYQDFLQILWSFQVNAFNKPKPSLQCFLDIFNTQFGQSNTKARGSLTLEQNSQDCLGEFLILQEQILGDQVKSVFLTQTIHWRRFICTVWRGGGRIIFPDEGDIFWGPHPDLHRLKVLLFVKHKLDRKKVIFSSHQCQTC